MDMEQLQESRERVEAMRFRQRLQEMEINGLKEQLATKRKKLSLQIHAIKANEKTIQLDPAIALQISEASGLLDKEREHLSTLKQRSKRFPDYGHKLMEKSKQFTEETLEYYDAWAEQSKLRCEIVLQMQRAYAAELKIRSQEAEELNKDLEKEVAGMHQKIEQLQGKTPSE